ncbi:hypothetical protein DPMN_075427 [Dreissena polymorpha]|uniref:Uncharacterized protein n=1 Tax=Dreissena polymorpha TaxID=45954 RepID=A0A9D3YL23_DREPO|nr:hypothetical protein DPMN_075427 [Dreissena polymorpha]
MEGTGVYSYTEINSNRLWTRLNTAGNSYRHCRVAGEDPLSRNLQAKNALPPFEHVFQPTGIIFELVQDIIGMNLLTDFHDDWTINVASRVLTRFNYSHVFHTNVTIINLIQDIIETNHLTKFHEDWTISVVSRVITRQMLKPHNAQQTKGDHKSLP